MLQPCVWKRDFPQPSRELPINIAAEGNSYNVWTPSIGLLHDAVDLPLFYPTPCSVTTRIDRDTYGYTVTYAVRNQTGTSQDLPTLQIPANLLNPVIQYLDHRTGCEWETVDASNGAQYSSPQPSYPKSLYAPVIIIRDSRFAVGFALEYDVLNYGHEIRTSVYRGADGSAYEGRWTARFYMDGTIQPGETRFYRIAAYYNLPKDWIHTMRPYKKFLNVNYGAVKYQQDMRPVYMQQLGDSGRLTNDNRRGFNGTRVDLNGFGREVDNEIDFMMRNGYKREIVRTCAGVYYLNRHNNFPPQIMTEWTGPMQMTGTQWRRVGDAGIELYFWWGRSGQYADRWDDDELEDFNPDNPIQAGRMLTEWRNAVSFGATGLGLDKFTVLRPWQALDWIDTLRTVKPDGKFVAEPAAYDILQINIPTYLTSDEMPSHAHLLADYLVPGREMWVQLEGADINLATARDFIRNGMTVVTNATDFGANDLIYAVHQAQRCD